MRASVFAVAFINYFDALAALEIHAGFSIGKNGALRQHR
jgi:hypothetical protein